MTRRRHPLSRGLGNFEREPFPQAPGTAKIEAGGTARTAFRTRGARGARRVAIKTLSGRRAYAPPYVSLISGRSASRPSLAIQGSRYRQSIFPRLLSQIPSRSRMSFSR